jgi:hypothetical protein
MAGGLPTAGQRKTLPDLGELGASERRKILGLRYRVGGGIHDGFGRYFIDVAGWGGPDVVAGFGLGEGPAAFEFDQVVAAAGGAQVGVGGGVAVGVILGVVGLACATSVVEVARCRSGTFL